MGALLLYVAFGIVALGYYFQDFFDVFVTEADTGIEDTQEDSGDGQDITPERSSPKKYDTDEGNAGAARDLDI